MKSFAMEYRYTKILQCICKHFSYCHNIFTCVVASRAFVCIIFSISAVCVAFSGMSVENQYERVACDFYVFICFWSFL